MLLCQEISLATYLCARLQMLSCEDKRLFAIISLPLLLSLSLRLGGHRFPLASMPQVLSGIAILHCQSFFFDLLLIN